MSLIAHVDLAAVRANIATMAGHTGTPICAVIKANGYGHGAPAIAAAALEAGATWLAVATIPEALEVAAEVPSGTPILVLSERPPDEVELIVDHRPAGLRLTVASAHGLGLAETLGGGLPVHLQVDTGMHRTGVAPAEAVDLARAVTGAPGVGFEGVCTHMAVADAPTDPFTDVQLDRFDAVLADLDAAGLRPPLVHAANSAAAIAHPRSRHDLVRMGITLYGVPPSDEMEGSIPLVPVLTLTAGVTALRTIGSGETVSYGRRWAAPDESRIATVPIGYADGLRWSSNQDGAHVLIGGLRCPIVGNVTMDQSMVLVDDDVRVGDEVAIIGAQGTDRITVSEVANRVATIGYEVLTSVGDRAQRHYS